MDKLTFTSWAVACIGVIVWYMSGRIKEDVCGWLAERRSRKARAALHASEAEAGHAMPPGKHTVTTREQVRVNGRVTERTATHIVTGVHGWETLCASGCTTEHGEDGTLRADAVEVARDRLPVTCDVCEAVWRDTRGFTADDFCPTAQMARYADSGQTEVSLHDAPDAIRHHG